MYNRKGFLCTSFGHTDIYQKKIHRELTWQSWHHKLQLTQFNTLHLAWRPDDKHCYSTFLIITLCASQINWLSECFTRLIHLACTYKPSHCIYIQLTVLLRCPQISVGKELCITRELKCMWESRCQTSSCHSYSYSCMYRALYIEIKPANINIYNNIVWFTLPQLLFSQYNQVNILWLVHHFYYSCVIMPVHISVDVL